MTIVLNRLFQEVTGCQAQSTVRLAGDGSNRTYYRLTADNTTIIGVAGVSLQENRAFIALAKRFNECSIRAPKVLAVSSDEMCYLLDDLGDTTLFAMLKEARESGTFGTADCEALCKVMSILPKIQYEVAQNFDFSICYPTPAFDRRSIFWDLNYYKYCFLKGAGVEFNEDELENEFEKLADILLKEECNTFLYRDFQSRNIMWNNDEPCFIDFQGGRRGPIYYDVASFVGQARAKYTPEAIETMLKAYMQAASAYRHIDEQDFRRKLNIFRIFRLMQNLGTYGYRGLYEHKKAFVESIPTAITQMIELLESIKEEFPLLYSLTRSTAELPRFANRESKSLTVDVLSFSYRRGIPEDYSGNGGGFVFDCRALHNPGRYEPYKKLTGLDAPVIEFLEKESEIEHFLQNAYSMTDNMVETYLKRGFTHIHICCGCTGGQHRSVYSAEHIAHHIADKYGVRVNVNHTMQNISYTIEERDRKEE